MLFTFHGLFLGLSAQAHILNLNSVLFFSAFVIFSSCFPPHAQPILLHALCSYARLFGALDVDTAPVALRLVARLLPLPGNQDRYAMGWVGGDVGGV